MTTSQPDETRTATRKTSEDAIPLLAFAGAGVRLGGRWIWREASFEVGGSEFVAILGPNGAGKSTLLKTALGLLPLSEGVVSILGREPRRGSSDVGYVPQRRSFDADVRIRGEEIVRLGLDGHRWGFALPLPSAARRRDQERVDAVLRLVDAARYADRPVGELSGGEQQRLLIAQALVARPRLLLLDEPLDSLDQTNQQQIVALLNRVCHEEGVSVILVTHDINPVLAYLDRVVYLAQGRVAVGPPAAIVNTETLSNLYGAPIEVLRASDGRLVVVGQAGTEAIAFHGHEH